MKTRETSVFSLLLPLILFLAAVVGSFLVARPVFEYEEFTRPSRAFLESAKRIGALDKKTSEIGFVSSTLRSDIERTLDFISIENMTLVTDQRTQLIALEATGFLHASKLNALFAEMDRPGVYVENFSLALGGARQTGSDDGDPVFTLRLKASLLPRRAAPRKK